LKRQRNSEYYARNKEQILKRRRQARENKKASMTLPNDKPHEPHTPLIQSHDDVTPSAPTNLEITTQTPLSISTGKFDQLLYRPVLIDILSVFSFSSMQTLKREGGKGTGSDMHKIRMKY
jgi:hypothetical protein